MMLRSPEPVTGLFVRRRGANLGWVDPTPPLWRHRPETDRRPGASSLCRTATRVCTIGTEFGRAMGSLAEYLLWTPAACVESTFGSAWRPDAVNLLRSKDHRPEVCGMSDLVDHVSDGDGREAAWDRYSAGVD